MSVLTEILARKRQRLAEAKANVSLERLREGKAGSHRFLTTLQRDAVNVIAEFKRRSPSKDYSCRRRRAFDGSML